MACALLSEDLLSLNEFTFQLIATCPNAATYVLMIARS